MKTLIVPDNCFCDHYGYCPYDPYKEGTIDLCYHWCGILEDTDDTNEMMKDGDPVC